SYEGWQSLVSFVNELIPDSAIAESALGSFERQGVNDARAILALFTPRSDEELLAVMGYAGIRQSSIVALAMLSLSRCKHFPPGSREPHANAQPYSRPPNNPCPDCVHYALTTWP